MVNLGDILNIQCKNCNYENTFCVGYGNLSAIALRNLLGQLNNKEEASIRTRLDPNELDQTVFTHQGLMQCEICLKIYCKIQFSFLGKGAPEEFTPFCDKCSHKLHPIIKISQVICGLCRKQSLVPENMGIWD